MERKEKRDTGEGRLRGNSGMEDEMWGTLPRLGVGRETYRPKAAQPKIVLSTFSAIDVHPISAFPPPKSRNN